MAIPGHPTNTTYRTIALEDWGVFMCGAQEGCPKGLGYLAHRHGRVDRAGTIHWVMADVRGSRRGFRHFMKLMAMAHNREWWTEPKWMKLYLTNVWAYKQTKRRYRFRIRAEWSRADRLEAWKLALRAKPRVGCYRWKHHAFYMWLMQAGLSPDSGVQSPVRKGVQPPA